MMPAAIDWLGTFECLARTKKLFADCGEDRLMHKSTDLWVWVEVDAVSGFDLRKEGGQLGLLRRVDDAGQRHIGAIAAEAGCEAAEWRAHGRLLLLNALRADGRL